MPTQAGLAFYAGWLLNPWPKEDGSDKKIRGKHKAMLTEQEYELIKQIKKGGIRNGIKKSRDNSNFPLRRFVLCPTCKHPLTGSISTGKSKKFSYYHCFNDGCPIRYRSIPKAEMEKGILTIKIPKIVKAEKEKVDIKDA